MSVIALQVVMLPPTLPLLLAAARAAVQVRTAGGAMPPQRRPVALLRKANSAGLKAAAVATESMTATLRGTQGAVAGHGGGLASRHAGVRHHGGVAVASPSLNPR